MEKSFTISEIIKLYNLPPATLYRKIKSGKLKTVIISKAGRKIKAVEETELTRVFGNIPGDNIRDNINMKKDNISDKSSGGITPEILEKTIEKVILTQQKQLMKPIEDQALYLAGKYEAENKFLKEKYETILRENEELRSGIKALPGPPEEVLTRLEELEKRNKELEEEQVRLSEQKEKELADLAATWREALDAERNKPFWKKIF